jgi:hypothetical protein
VIFPGIKNVQKLRQFLNKVLKTRKSKANKTLKINKFKSFQFPKNSEEL